MNKNERVFSVIGKLPWDHTREEDLFFEPKIESHVIGGHDTGFRTVYRELENGIEPISSVTQWYTLIPNRFLDETIKRNSIVPFTLNEAMSTTNIKSTRLVYDMDIEVDLGSDDTDGGLRPQLLINNSYDGSRAFYLELGIFRLICSNGLIINEADTGKIEKRHKYSGIDQIRMEIADYVKKSINSEKFDSIRERILAAKEKKQTHIPFPWLLKQPYEVLFQIFRAVETHCSYYVFTQDKKDRYSLKDEKSSMALVQKIIASRNQGNPNDYLVKQYNETQVYYDKPVTNQWLLFNMLLQFLQLRAAQHKRLQKASELSQVFL